MNEQDPGYITVEQTADGKGWRVIARRSDMAGVQILVTPHEKVAYGVKKDLDAVIQ